MKEFSDEKDQKKKKWKMQIHAWLGNRQLIGEWIGESVATNMKRTYEHHTRGADGKIVKRNVEELVHVHGGYRPSLDGEKKTRKAFYFRGARVWREA